MGQTTDLSEKIGVTTVGTSNKIAIECLELEQKLFDLVKYVKNIQERRVKANLDTFLKLYNESGGKIVKHFLEPLKQSFLPMLPESREPGFYTLTAAKSKRSNLVSYSPICSTLTKTSPIDVFIYNNGLVACALLLMRLSDLYTDQRITSASDMTHKLTRTLTMKYYLECCPCRHSSLALDFTLMFYCLSSRFRKFSSSYKDARLPLSEALALLRRYFPLVNLFLDTFTVDFEYYADPHYVGLISQCGDLRRQWIFLCLGQREEDDKKGTGGSRSGPILVTMFPVENVTSVFSQIMILGDYLLASMNSWLLAKYLFVLSYTAQGSTLKSLKYTAKRLLACAQQLESHSFMSGERYTKYHETLQQQGHIMHILLDIPEAEEVLISSICKLLDEKSCDDELARKLTLPLVKKVASYGRPSPPHHRETEPTREDFLDILLYVRLLNPRSTAMALDVILYQYRWLRHQFKNGMGSSKKFTLESSFKFLILAYPILLNEVFIRNSLPSIYSIGNNLSKIDEVLNSFNPLLKRLGNLRHLWINDQQNENSRGRKLATEQSLNMTTCETSCEDTSLSSNDECFTEQNKVEDIHLLNKCVAVSCRGTKMSNKTSSTTETNKLLHIPDQVQIARDLALDNSCGPYNNDGEKKDPSVPVATNRIFIEDEYVKFKGNGTLESSVKTTQKILPVSSVINTMDRSCDVVLTKRRTDGGSTAAVSGGKTGNGESTVADNETKADAANTENTDSVTGENTDYAVNWKNIEDSLNRKNTDDTLNRKNTDDTLNRKNTDDTLNRKNTDDTLNQKNTDDTFNGKKPNDVGNGKEPDDAINGKAGNIYVGSAQVKANLPDRDECLLLKYCKLCDDTLQFVDKIHSETIHRNVGSKRLHELHRIRSTDDAVDMCRKMKYDLVNTFPETEDIPTRPCQTTMLRLNLRECLQLLIRQAQQSNCTREKSDFVPALDDVAKLKDMFLKLVQPTDNDLEHLVNWMQNLESYL